MALLLISLIIVICIAAGKLSYKLGLPSLLMFIVLGMLFGSDGIFKIPFAVISLPYGVEGFATPKHLVKEDGSQAQVDEKLSFKVIEFNKEAKRIILSHSRIFEDEQKGAKATSEKKASSKRGGKKEEESGMVTGPVEKTTLGDIEELAALKEKLSGK